MSEETIAEFLTMQSFAVFGATDRREDTGYRLVKRLARTGYQPYPINPRIAKIGSMRCYGTLDDLPGVPQVVVIALPPDCALEVLKSCAAHGVRRFWIEPGSESDDVLTYISEHGLSAVVSESLRQRLGKN